MTKIFPMGGSTYSLQSSISSTQTTITLTSFTVPVEGSDITMALMNTDIAYGTIAPRTTQSEFISFTGITQNGDGTATLTGVTRGLNKTYPYTEDSNFKLPHAGATQFILSDAPQLFNRYAALSNDNTFTGQQIFPSSGGASSALVGVSYVAPVQDTEVASKKYVDLVAVFGAPFATTSTAGIVLLPSQTQVEAGTPGDNTNGYRVLPNSAYGARNYIGYATGAGSPNTYTATVTPTPTGYASGQIVGVMMPNQNTGNATLNINGLGAKDVWLGGTGLIAGAFATNSIVGMVYDGTRFNIIWSSDGQSASATANKLALRNSTGDVTVSTTPTATTDATSKAYVDGGTYRTFANGSTTKNAADASTTQNIAHGLGRAPKFVKITAMSDSAVGTGTNAVPMAFTVYNGTTQSSLSCYTNGASSTFATAQTFTINAGATNGTQAGVVTFDSTNIIITWTKTNSPSGTFYLTWEAQ